MFAAGARGRDSEKQRRDTGWHLLHESEPEEPASLGGVGNGFIFCAKPDYAV
jgi:hypothetical protein